MSEGDTPASGAEGGTLTAEQIAAIEHLHEISDSHDRWDSTPLLIADLRSARTEVAALRDRLARAEGRERMLRDGLDDIIAIVDCEPDEDVARASVRKMAQWTLKRTHTVTAPTDGAAPQRAADDGEGE